MAAKTTKGAKVSMEMPASVQVNGDRIPMIRVEWKPRLRFTEHDSKAFESLHRSLIDSGAKIDMGDNPPKPVYTRPDVITWLVQQYAAAVTAKNQTPPTSAKGTK
jgi:hypothetical protein